MSARSRRSARDRGRRGRRRRSRDLVARKAVRLEALERDVSVLFPGAADAIRRAAAAVPIAIASGARGDEIRRVLDARTCSHCFTAIVAAEDTPVEQAGAGSVPARGGAARAGRRRAVAAADCVAIEDSRWGLESARAAGLRTVARHQHLRRRRAVADLTIASLEAMDLDLLSPRSVPISGFTRTDQSNPLDSRLFLARF